MLCRGLLFSQRLTSNSLWYCLQVRGILEEYRIGRLKGGQTAQVGCGVALLPRFLVEEELAEGKLVIPWPHAMPSQDAYYLAYPEHSAEVPKVRNFVKWMMEQVI